MHTYVCLVYVLLNTDCVLGSLALLLNICFLLWEIYSLDEHFRKTENPTAVQGGRVHFRMFISVSWWWWHNFYLEEQDLCWCTFSFYANLLMYYIRGSLLQRFEISTRLRYLISASQKFHCGVKWKQKADGVEVCKRPAMFHQDLLWHLCVAIWYFYFFFFWPK